MGKPRIKNKKQAREEIQKAKNNQKMMVAVIFVIAANIVNGDFLLNDVDDLLERPDLNKLKLEINKQQLKLAKAAQASEAKERQKKASKGNNPKAGKGKHTGR